ncbi:jg16102 [Pararge aegeria aegeria]|uniref:Jg16102 protein n=1 Tax=Pararge aegeria aegeria TaxID=348720 RepID=A0A8S4SA60_9NEOP|nr:jg16102 [Pararge aegeria aegeria]
MAQNRPEGCKWKGVTTLSNEEHDVERECKDITIVQFHWDSNSATESEVELLPTRLQYIKSYIRVKNNYIINLLSHLHHPAALIALERKDTTSALVEECNVVYIKLTSLGIEQKCRVPWLPDIKEIGATKKLMS